jgi:hypothetical protein
MNLLTFLFRNSSLKELGKDKSACMWTIQAYWKHKVIIHTSDYLELMLENETSFWKEESFESQNVYVACTATYYEYHISKINNVVSIEIVRKTD